MEYRGRGQEVHAHFIIVVLASSCQLSLLYSVEITCSIIRLSHAMSRARGAVVLAVALD